MAWLLQPCDTHAFALFKRAMHTLTEMLQLLLWMVVLTSAHAFGACLQPSSTCCKATNGNEHLKRLGCAGPRMHWAEPLFVAWGCQATVKLATHSLLQAH